MTGSNPSCKPTPCFNILLAIQAAIAIVAAGLRAAEQDQNPNVAARKAKVKNAGILNDWCYIIAAAPTE